MTRRLVLDISEALDSELCRLADVRGTTKGEVMRRGFALAKVAIDEKSRGNRIGIIDWDGRLIGEITGI